MKYYCLWWRDIQLLVINMDPVLPSLLSASCFSGICFLLPCNFQRSCNVWRVRLHHSVHRVRAALLSFFSSGRRLSSLLSSLLPKSKSNLTSLPEKPKISALHPANCTGCSCGSAVSSHLPAINFASRTFRQVAVNRCAGKESLCGCAWFLWSLVLGRSHRLRLLQYFKLTFFVRMM